MSTSVGTQSRDAKISFLTVPGWMWPGQRTTSGARMPPSQVLSFPPLKGVVPPSGKVIVSAPLSVVKATRVLSSWPMSSSFLSTTPMLSSNCFMPASLTPQSLPPGSPTIAMYLSGNTVVTCMRAGLYQTKKGLPVFFGSLRSRKSTTLAEISSSTVLERSSVSGPSSLQVWFFAVPSEDLHESIGRGGVRQVAVLGSTAPGTSGTPGIGVFLQGGATVCCVGVLLMSGKLTPCMASRWYRYPQNSWKPCAVGKASVWSPRWFFPNSPVL